MEHTPTGLKQESFKSHHCDYNFGSYNVVFLLYARYEFDVSDESIPVGVAVVTFILLIFTCLLGISIAAYALYRIFYKNASELKNVDKLTIDTAVSCIILHAITVIIDPIGYYFWARNEELAANITWLIWDVFWTLSKLNLYFIYIYRCYITFKATKYAHSPMKVYVPLGIAWCLQLLNMIIFMLHELDDIDAISDEDNPLSSDKVVVITSSVYLVLDFFIVLSLFLFINPITKLMADLRDKSRRDITINIPNFDSKKCIDGDKLVRNGNDGTDQNIIYEDNDGDSPTESTGMVPHSPTKMGQHIVKQMEEASYTRDTKDCTKRNSEKP